MQFFSYMYKLQQVFEGRKYSREENYSSLGGFDGGNYMRKYDNLKLLTENKRAYFFKLFLT